MHNNNKITRTICNSVRRVAGALNTISEKLDERCGIAGNIVGMPVRSMPPSAGYRMDINRANIVNGDMQERIDALHNALETIDPYMREVIYPKLEEAAENEADKECLLAQWRRYVQSSYLMYVPKIQSYTIVRHYFTPDMENIYIIAIDKNTMYGFSIYDGCNAAEYGTFDESHYKQFQCESSEFIGRTVKDIRDQNDIPSVKFYEFFDVFQ